jgi:hypothetical protein
MAEFDRYVQSIRSVLIRSKWIYTHGQKFAHRFDTPVPGGNPKCIDTVPVSFVYVNRRVLAH